VQLLLTVGQGLVEHFELVDRGVVTRVRLLQQLLAAKAPERLGEREPRDIDTASLVGLDRAVTGDRLQLPDPLPVGVDLALQRLDVDAESLDAVLGVGVALGRGVGRVARRGHRIAQVVDLGGAGGRGGTGDEGEHQPTHDEPRSPTTPHPLRVPWCPTPRAPHVNHECTSATLPTPG